MKQILIVCLGSIAVIVRPGAVLAQEVQERGPRFSFVETKHDFDTVSKDSALDYKFVFTNSGTENLIIFAATPTCECMEVKFSTGPIGVGQEGWVSVHVPPGMLSMRFNKGIFIRSNSVDADPALNAYELRILGVIGEKARVEKPIKRRKK